ncbi:MAG: hypothetical protein ACYTCN_03405, partial [Planctomycetota bacterium]
IVSVVYGFIALLLIPAIAAVNRVVGSEEKTMLQLTIAVLIALLLSHISLYRMLRNLQIYKWKAVVLIGVVLSYIVLMKCMVGGVIKPHTYEQQLKSEIAGATKIKVFLLSFEHPEGFTDAEGFTETNKEKIRDIIENITVTPFGNRGFCECIGNQKVVFYDGEEICAELTFHHGKSFRWPEGPWKSDMKLTSKSAAYTKKWMSQNGIKDFE